MALDVDIETALRANGVGQRERQTRSSGRRASSGWTSVSVGQQQQQQQQQQRTPAGHRMSQQRRSHVAAESQQLGLLSIASPSQASTLTQDTSASTPIALGFTSTSTAAAPASNSTRRSSVGPPSLGATPSSLAPQQPQPYRPLQMPTPSAEWEREREREHERASSLLIMPVSTSRRTTLKRSSHGAETDFGRSRLQLRRDNSLDGEDFGARTARRAADISAREVIELALDPSINIRPAQPSSPWGWLLISLIVLALQLASAILSGPDSVLGEEGLADGVVASVNHRSSTYRDTFNVVGWVAHYAGMVFLVICGLIATARRHPLHSERSILLFAILSLAFLIAAAVLHTISMRVSMAALFGGSNSDDPSPEQHRRTQAVQLGWAGNLILYVMFAVLAYRAPRSTVRRPDKEGADKLATLESIKFAELARRRIEAEVLEYEETEKERERLRLEEEEARRMAYASMLAERLARRSTTNAASASSNGSGQLFAFDAGAPSATGTVLYMPHADGAVPVQQAQIQTQPTAPVRHARAASGQNYAARTAPTQDSAGRTTSSHDSATAAAVAAASAAVAAAAAASVERIRAATAAEKAAAPAQAQKPQHWVPISEPELEPEPKEAVPVPAPVKPAEVKRGEEVTRFAPIGNGHVRRMSETLNGAQSATISSPSQIVPPTPQAAAPAVASPRAALTVSVPLPAITPSGSTPLPPVTPTPLPPITPTPAPAPTSAQHPLDRIFPSPAPTVVAPHASDAHVASAERQRGVIKVNRRSTVGVMTAMNALGLNAQAAPAKDDTPSAAQSQQNTATSGTTATPGAAAAPSLRDSRVWTGTDEAYRRRDGSRSPKDPKYRYHTQRRTNNDSTPLFSPFTAAGASVVGGGSTNPSPPPADKGRRNSSGSHHFSFTPSARDSTTLIISPGPTAAPKPSGGGGGGTDPHFAEAAASYVQSRRGSGSNHASPNPATPAWVPSSKNEGPRSDGGSNQLSPNPANYPDMPPTMWAVVGSRRKSIDLLAPHLSTPVPATADASSKSNPRRRSIQTAHHAIPVIDADGQTGVSSSTTHFPPPAQASLRASRRATAGLDQFPPKPVAPVSGGHSRRASESRQFTPGLLASMGEQKSPISTDSSASPPHDFSPLTQSQRARASQRQSLPLQPQQPVPTTSPTRFVPSSRPLSHRSGSPVKGGTGVTPAASSTLPPPQFNDEDDSSTLAAAIASSRRKSMLGMGVGVGRSDSRRGSTSGSLGPDRDIVAAAAAAAAHAAGGGRRRSMQLPAAERHRVERVDSDAEEKA